MSPVRSSVVIVVSVVVAGCLVGERTTLPDTDADGLVDEAESRGWNVTLRTDAATCPPTAQAAERPPTKTYHVTSNTGRIDTDNDGLTDEKEFVLRSDPHIADTDGDGLTDKMEWDLRTLSAEGALAVPSFLSAADVDSDSDCLTDWEELDGFDVEGQGHVTSDPTARDGDRDFHSDWYEVFVSRSDPLNPDTDGDGHPDGLDVDPRRDLVVWLNLTRVRVDAESTGHHRAFVIVQNLSFGDAWRGAHQRGVWVDHEAPGPGLVDVPDGSSGLWFFVTFDWQLTDADGFPAGLLHMNPMDNSTQAFLRVDPIEEEWAFEGADGSAQRFHRDCLVEGSDGAFEFDLRFATVGQDPAGEPSRCKSA